MTAERTGVWIVGARGGVATTLTCGVLALAEDLTPSIGLVTGTELFADTPLVEPESLVIGGHEIRDASLEGCAREIASATGTLSPTLLDRIAPGLRSTDARIRPGVLFRSGSAIEGLPGIYDGVRGDTPLDAYERIVADLTAFREENDLDRVVMVNLASTEPSIATHAAHSDAAALERALEDDDPAPFIASTLYALAAARTGAAFLNFTPSPGALLPAVDQIFTREGVPFMGSDGKTGETLVKSALAPMFHYRNLRVLSWQGYNMLGDRDGEILAHEENRRTKITSKDQLLHDYLGYPLHSKVTIDYVPSLDDWKTAWDFIHFEGFLGVKMSLQFTWQGCDSILAAPLVIDMVRLLDHALRTDHGGVQSQLAVFFKSPHRGATHDLHQQFHQLIQHYASS